MTVAAAVAIGCYGAAVEAVQPDAETRVCSDVGTNVCALGSVEQSDVNDRELEGPAVERNGLQQTPPPLFLVPGTGNMTIQGNAAELRAEVFDEIGIFTHTPLPLRTATAAAPAGRIREPISSSGRTSFARAMTTSEVGNLTH